MHPAPRRVPDLRRGFRRGAGRVLPFAAVLAICALVLPRAAAQEGGTPGSPDDEVEAGARPKPEATTGAPDGDAPTPWITVGKQRWSELHGAAVKDDARVSLGRIDDLVIDPADDRLQAFVIALPSPPTDPASPRPPTRFVVVPPGALRHRTDTGMGLAADRSVFDRAPSFVAADWPSLTDRRWIADAWRLFGQQPYWPEKSAASAAAWHGERASRLLALGVGNPEGETLGTIADLVIDTTTLLVPWFVVLPGPALGMNNGLFVVPWREARLQGDRILIPLRVSEAEDMPTFNANLWPDLDNEHFLEGVSLYYRMHRLPPEPAPPGG